MPKQSARQSKVRCRLCGAGCSPLGSKASLLRAKIYHYHACATCGFIFISDPWTDYAKIYNLAYYQGQHGDAGIDYIYEMEHLKTTVRRVEYRGLLELARHLVGRPSFEWLDFGCGHGGLLPYVREHSQINIQGFEEGAIAKRSRAKGIPILTRQTLFTKHKRFDLISAIEVIEHSPDPLKLLAQIKRLLKPGGVLLLTTGNARPHKAKLLDWSYARAPDVHVSFFQPKTLALAYRKVGLTPLAAGYAPGLTRIIQYKVLKALGIKKDSVWFKLLPWWLIARVVDRAYQVSAMPMATLSASASRRSLS